MTSSNKICFVDPVSIFFSLISLGPPVYPPSNYLHFPSTLMLFVPSLFFNTFLPCHGLLCSSIVMHFQSCEHR
ncbi:rCG36639 [Rattus norvegicus]|uniref:RCG36639 n=1 Tax=Rattus norvegicus TaxID=10116 RepID=A6JS02_RAT|nr:rCG36639 [Rattus norvegicus]